MTYRTTAHGVHLSGNTAERPPASALTRKINRDDGGSPTSISVLDGLPYFDETLGRPLRWIEDRWLQHDGSEPPGVAAINAAGTAIGNAAEIARGTSVVAGADDTAGVRLPAAVPGAVCMVINDDDANAALKVYPAVNASINLEASNAALSMPTNTSVKFMAVSESRWITVPRVPS